MISRRPLRTDDITVNESSAQVSLLQQWLKGSYFNLEGASVGGMDMMGAIAIEGGAPFTRDLTLIAPAAGAGPIFGTYPLGNLRSL